MSDVINFYSKFHTLISRDYLARAINPNRAQNIIKAKRFGKDYWDGSRDCGYGGYKYTGAHHAPATAISSHYGLKASQSVLDIGCGKGHLLYELQSITPGLQINGLDISQYAIKHAPAKIRQNLKNGVCWNLPYATKQFDLVLAVNLLHNVPGRYLESTIKEIMRVSKGPAWILVESWRTEQQKINFLNWQLTAESFYSTNDWKWLFAYTGYTGDFGFEVHQ